MICGHDRETLQRALEFANSSNLDAVSRNWPRPTDDGDVLFDVHDPAKLAAIIAELLPRQGFDVAYDGRIAITHENGTSLLTMPQARALALRLLDATTATAQDIERMIGEL